MAKQYTASDGRKYVVVEKGDTLWDIAADYLGSGSKYTQLAAINNISNPNLIYVGQKIYLSKTTTTTTKKSTNSNKVTITHFGLQSNTDNTLFVTWNWSKSNTESYKVVWYYATGDGIWFVGSDSNNTIDKNNPSASRQSTYNIPSQAERVMVRIKPISKTKTKNGKETSYWTAEWSTEKKYEVKNLPPVAPSSAPSVEIEKFKLTAELNNLDTEALHATEIQFQIVKNDSTVYKTGKATIKTGHVSYSCTVAAGHEYKVRCRSVRGKLYSDWTAYSENKGTIPTAPAEIKNLRAASDTSVLILWSEVASAKTYDIQYVTDVDDFWYNSDKITPITGIDTNVYTKTGLESGTEYFFRVRAVNEAGESDWTAPKSVILGDEPAAPTTWSSSTTVITGEPLVLYWVHNTKDGSKQTAAKVEISVGGTVNEIPLTFDTTDLEDDEDPTRSYPVNTAQYAEGTKLQWRVCTAGITGEYSEWSVQRTVDIYAPPNQELRITDKDGNDIDTLTAFPFYVSVLPGPETQRPIGYHISVTSNETYPTVDNLGNDITVNVGQELYSKYFDINDSLLVEFSAGNINLENNVEYTIRSTVSMDSGLTSEATITFDVSWVDAEYLPNAEIGIDDETLVAHIRPYCEEGRVVYYAVVRNGSDYVKTEEELDFVYGLTDAFDPITTTTGEQVYSGIDADGNSVYYCEVEEGNIIDHVTLAVYRREFDGTFTELGTGIDNTKYTYITDPHPALDFARYRVVATDTLTGAVSYYDVPGEPVGGAAVVIQWDEEWSNFDTNVDDLLEEPPWAGSMLKIPYNIDVTDSNSADIALIEYIGREHPIGYYGTQLGQSATWSMQIPKDDKETLYGLRRLARWMGDVYVREPSGSGYWATVSVGFSQKHLDVTIPVTLNITRVEGGA